MTEDELKSLVASEIRTAYGYLGGRLSNERVLAQRYYLGMPYGDEQDDRSQVITTEVRDAVESVLPMLLRLFVSSDKMFEFEPETEKDEDSAKQATDYVNLIYNRDNPGFLNTYTVFKDGLLFKNGVLKHKWNVTERVSTEDYTGQTIDQVAALLEPGSANETIELVSQKTYPAPDESQPALALALAPPSPPVQAAPPQPGQLGAAPAGPPPQAQAGSPPQVGQNALNPMPPQIGQAAQNPMPPQGMPPQPPPMPEPVMLYDVTIKRTAKIGRVKLMAVPPEEFLISRRAKSVSDATLVAHRFRKRRGDLVAEGYDEDDVMKLTANDAFLMNQEKITRDSFDNEDASLPDSNGTDPLNEEVVVVESYVRCNYNGDGKLVIRQVVSGEDASIILANEPWDDDGAPFVADIKPIILTHHFEGISIADLLLDIQYIRSTVYRQLLDNIYQINNQRTELPEAAIGTNTIDDLLTNRPGGIVRTKGSGGMMKQMETTSIISDVLPLLDKVEKETQNRTGIIPFQQILDPDMLQGTATGQNLMSEALVERVELIARIFAEGMKEVGKAILKLIVKHQDAPRMIKLRNEWVPMDPRTWNVGMDVKINVGLGTGNKAAQLQHLATILGIQKDALISAGGLNGMVTPENIYHTCVEIVENAGISSADPFFNDPAKAGPAGAPPPKPDPETMKAQAAIQVQQAQQQQETVESQHRMQLAQEESQQKMQIMQQDAAGKLQLQREKFAADHALEQQRISGDIDLRKAEMAMKYQHMAVQAAQQPPAPV